MLQPLQVLIASHRRALLIGFAVMVEIKALTRCRNWPVRDTRLKSTYLSEKVKTIINL